MFDWGTKVFKIFLCISFLFLFGNTPTEAQPESDLKINVIAPPTPPTSYINENGVVVGTSIDIALEFLESKNFNYTTEVLPWARGYRKATTTTGCAIFIDRTPERENEFHWLKRLRTIRPVLFTRASEDLVGLSKEDFSHSDYTAICVNNSSQCDTLRELGFTEKNILLVSTGTQGDVTELVLRKRADFFIGDVETVQNAMLELGMDYEALAIHTELPQIENYLAVSKNFDPKLLEALKSN